MEGCTSHMCMLCLRRGQLDLMLRGSKKVIVSRQIAMYNLCGRRSSSGEVVYSMLEPTGASFISNFNKLQAMPCAKVEASEVA